MAIEYVEIRDANSRELIGIVDTASSIIWHSVYYGVGDFEVYAPCTPETVQLLVVGNYVTRYDARNVGVIESISVEFSEQDGRVIVATGRFVKSMLDRRLIYARSGYSVAPTILKGNVEDAARRLVSENAISCAFDSGRNMQEFTLGAHAGTTEVIIDGSGSTADKQVTYKGLLEYTDSLLQEYGLGAYCELDENKQFAYTVFAGIDRSVDNTDGNEPIIFSQDFDNLLSSSYVYDVTALKNTALIGGQGEGTARFCSILKSESITGSARREVFVEASSSSKTYKDDSGTEQTLTDAEYDQQLKTMGKQTVAENAIVETFDGEIDLTNGSFKYGADYYLGDWVTVADVEVGLQVNVRILEVTEVQDANGYQLDAVYGK